MHTNICLIGSSRFELEFRKLEVELSILGNVVLSPLVYTHPGDNPECGMEAKYILDFVQKEKIRRVTLFLL